ncbi:MAG: hypothetical protein CVT77_14820, partial [Alphaproteobacteria bacterium HGW-Alphaproteobacteria-16]
MNELDAIAEAFVSARKEMRSLPEYPGTVPTSIGDAYAIQDRALTLAEGEVAGWKVGRIGLHVFYRTYGGGWS